jgi:HlyD family secretion protein
MKAKKWLFIPAGLVVIVILWLATQHGEANVSVAAFAPEVEKVVRGDIRVEVSATGVIQPINKVEIKSKASGLIEEMPIEESDVVKKGDLIAKLDQRDTKNAYDQAVADLQVAEATVKQRESDFNRKKELYEKGLVSADELDQIKLTLVDAQAQVVRDKINLDNNDIKLKDTIVRSPIDGIILTKDVEVGQIISSGISSVSGGTLIATVADMKEVYVKADVDEVDIGQIFPEMKARVVADAFPNDVFQGEVIRVAAQSTVTQNVTTFQVTIKVSNASGKLKAGMNCSVDILVADKKAVVLVPNEALMDRKDLMQELSKIRMASDQNQKPTGSARPEWTGRQGGGFPPGMRQQNQNSAEGDMTLAQRGVIIKKGDQYFPKMVKPGVTNFDQTEILEGLNEGDEIVYSFFSRAKQSSEEFRQRLSNRADMTGFRSRNSNNTSSPR